MVYRRQADRIQSGEAPLHLENTLAQTVVLLKLSEKAAEHKFP